MVEMAGVSFLHQKLRQDYDGYIVMWMRCITITQNLMPRGSTSSNASSNRLTAMVADRLLIGHPTNHIPHPPHLSHFYY